MHHPNPLQALTTLFFLASCITFPLTTALLLPKPTGPYTVGTRTLKLTDPTRIDPSPPNSNNNTNHPRALMLSSFYPVSKVHPSTNLCQTPYIPGPLTASFLDAEFAPFGIPAGTFSSIKLQSACETNKANADTATDTTDSRSAPSAKHTLPTLLFSPGQGVSRLLYSALAQNIASHGFVVISIDHPGDADVVEFPDGTVVYSTFPRENATLEDVAKAVDVRVQDTAFVLRMLERQDVVGQLVGKGSGTGTGTRQPFVKLDVRKGVGMYGHSLGGATAASAAFAAPQRIKGVANLDGSMFGRVVKEGLGREQAFMMFGRTDHNSSMDETVAGVVGMSKGWKREVVVRGATHLAYSDLALLASLVGLQPVLGDVVGTVEGVRMMGILTRYLVAFFEFVLMGKRQELLQKQSREYPEVVFV